MLILSLCSLYLSHLSNSLSTFFHLNPQHIRYREFINQQFLIKKNLLAFNSTKLLNLLISLIRRKRNTINQQQHEIQPVKYKSSPHKGSKREKKKKKKKQDPQFCFHKKKSSNFKPKQLKEPW